MTLDLDIFVDVEHDNPERLLTVLVDFGFGEAGVEVDDLRTVGKVFMLGVEPYRIDILTSISGVSFQKVWANADHGDLGGVPTKFISRKELIVNKSSTGRTKDLADIEALGS